MYWGRPKVSAEKSERVLLRISHAHVPHAPSPLCIIIRGPVGGGGLACGLVSTQSKATMPHSLPQTIVSYWFYCVGLVQ